MKERLGMLFSLPRSLVRGERLTGLPMADPFPLRLTPRVGFRAQPVRWKPNLRLARELVGIRAISLAG